LGLVEGWMEQRKVRSDLAWQLGTEVRSRMMMGNGSMLSPAGCNPDCPQLVLRSVKTGESSVLHIFFFFFFGTGSSWWWNECLERAAERVPRCFYFGV